MATITISGKFGNNTDLARRVVTFLPLDSPFGSGNEVVFGPEFSEVLDENGDASFTMLEGNYLCWLKGYESATATIAVPSGSGTHNINSIFATSTASGLNSVSTGQLDWQDRSTAPTNPPSGFFKVYFRGGVLYKLNSSGTETAFTGDVAGPASSVNGNFASFSGTGGKTLQDSGSSASSFAGATHASNHTDGTDDIQDATSGQKGLMTAAYASKLDGIEAAADVTDEENVTDALDGATLTDVGTPASGDKILLQDASDSDNLKVALFSEFGGGASDHGALSGLTDDDHTQYSLISSQAGAPSSTPSRVGEVNVDTTGDVPYVSTDTAGSGDWRGLYTFDGTDVAVADGGTGASTASGARTNLGLAIGSDVQAWSTNLDDFSAKSAPSGDVVGTSGFQTVSDKTITDALSISCLGNIVATTGQVLGGELAKALATANRAAYFNASGFLTEATTTTTELNYLSGATSNIQTQLDGKAASSHTHAASEITSGTLTHERGGLEADVSAYDGLVKITGGATSAVPITAAGAALLEDANAALQRATLGLGNVENTALSTWAGSGNITTVGTLASGAVPTSLLTGTLPDARVAESNVTQHQAALSITESQISDLGSYVALDATLDAATGNEVATTLAYTTNKATSGNDTGLLINKTDTASPGTSYLLDLQTGGVRQAGVQDNGSLTANDISATGALSYLHSLNITTGNITAATGNFEATAGDISCASGTLTTSAVEVIGATGNRAVFLNGTGFLTESATTNTELGYLSGVTSAIQTQIDGKGDASGPGSSTDNAIPRYDGTGGKTFQNSLATIDDTGGISATSSKSYLHSLDITTGSITAATGNFEATAGDISCASGTLTTSAVEMIGATGSRALYLDGSGFVAESATTDTELGYLSGATSNIQTQIDGLPTATSTTTFTNKTHTNPASTKQTLTDGATINWDTDSGHIAQVTLGGNRTMAAPTNLNIGTYILEVIQDGTGSRTITWNAVFKWPGGTAPTLTTTASAKDIITFYCDGTNLYGVESLNFS